MHYKDYTTDDIDLRLKRFETKDGFEVLGTVCLTQSQSVIVKTMLSTDSLIRPSCILVAFPVETIFSIRSRKLHKIFKVMAARNSDWSVLPCKVCIITMHIIYPKITQRDQERKIS